MGGFSGFPFSNNPTTPFGFSPSSSATPATPSYGPSSSNNPFHFSATKQTNDDATIKSIVEAVEKLEKTEGFPPEILQQIKNELKKIYPNISFKAKNNTASNSQGSESSTSSTTTSTSSNNNNNNNNTYSFTSNNNNYNNIFNNGHQEFINNYLLSFQQYSINDQLQFAQVQAQVAQAQVQAQVAQAQAQVQAQVAQAQAQAQVQAQVQMMQQSYMNTLGNIGTTPGIISPNYFGNTYPSYASDYGPQNGGAGATSNVANTVKMMLEMMGNGNNGFTGTAFGGIGGAATGFGSEGFSALSFLGGILGGFGL